MVSFFRRSFSLGLFSAASLAPAVASQSPFMPAGNSAVIAPVSPDSGAELVGMISTSKQTLVGISEKTTHRSLWVPVGQTMDGIEVMSCDPALNRAVVKIGGQIRTLAMHESPVSTTPASQVKFTSIATNPAPPSVIRTTPLTENEKKENEARMLVSDLMEIGMQQRKAYEEAQRKAVTRGN